MKLFRSVGVLLVLLILGAGYVGYELTRPYAHFGEETFVDLPKGTSTAEMAAVLERAGVIPHAWDYVSAGYALLMIFFGVLSFRDSRRVR